MQIPLKEKKSFAQMVKENEVRRNKAETGASLDAAPVESYQVGFDGDE
jgi:hypothetical protein